MEVTALKMTEYALQSIYKRNRKREKKEIVTRTSGNASKVNELCSWQWGIDPAS